MNTTVAVIGGGLSGLYAAKLLHDAGVDFKLLEARNRLGGRILSVDESYGLSRDGFDLGPSWFWPETQANVTAVVNDLGLQVFPQNNDGDVLFERMSRETAWRYRATHQEPQSMRIVGGSGALVAALTASLPQASILLATVVEQMELVPDGVRIAVLQGDTSQQHLTASRVIAAMPPRLLARIALSPAIDVATERLWRGTATWMAPHAKFFALYDRPFWRDAGLSGTAQSLLGPLGEIHDATTRSGRAALFGFPSVGADARSAMGEAAFKRVCLEQLGRLFGPQALTPRATLLKDWAADALTATAEDRTGGAHPEPARSPWVAGAWQERLWPGGSETSDRDPGYMAGALRAAEVAVASVLRTL